MSNHRIDNRAERFIDFMGPSFATACAGAYIIDLPDIINIICGFLSEGNRPQEAHILDSSAASKIGY